MKNNMINYFDTNQIKNFFSIKNVGKNVFIKNNCSIENPKKISIGDNVRIDDFCVFSGKSKISIGSNVHIGPYSFFNSSDKITLEDYVSLSNYVAIFTGTEDIDGGFFANPTLDEKYRNPSKGKIVIRKYSWIGPKCTILPNTTLNRGVAVLGHSLVSKSLPSWKIFYGNPIKFLKNRKKNIIKITKQYEKSFNVNKKKS